MSINLQEKRKETIGLEWINDSNVIQIIIMIFKYSQERKQKIRKKNNKEIRYMYMKLFFNSHITFPYQILIQNHCIFQMIKKMFTYNRRFRNHEISIFLYFSLFYNSHQNIFFMCIVGFPCLTKKIRF